MTVREGKNFNASRQVDNNSRKKNFFLILSLEKIEFRCVKFETSGGIQVLISNSGVKLNLRKERSAQNCRSGSWLLKMAKDIKKREREEQGDAE